MHPHLTQRQNKSLLDEPLIHKKLHFNYEKNKELDHTALIDKATEAFDYEACKESYWNPEQLSLMHGTPLWDEASQTQRIILNQLYWIAYYSQIVSAEIATIYFNHIAATGLYSLEDFRIICDTLDLETRQERSHIHAFKTISEDVEWRLFGKRLFTYPMRGPLEQTMVFADRNRFSDFWRKLRLKAYSLISPQNAFLASQYLLIRGLRTLNGKLIQHKLAKDYMVLQDKSIAPIPTQINYFHFMDESYHFNTSKIVGLEIIKCLEKPTAYETWVVNKAIEGCQQDHFNFSVVVNGIFWYEPALYRTMYQLLTSNVFNMDKHEALNMLKRCFTQENEAMHKSFELHNIAIASYKALLSPLAYLNKTNKEMTIMSKNNIGLHLKQNQRQFKRFIANEKIHH
ncbi:P-aminobenzoate N-oxygenase AurF [Candidatus Berkiella aquae]|uniref:p-aminobenzoate N-oxygenase AurF n=1 Tax=Candidatus Berkiella aquae TaxID=295108 RepID=A0A0Q9YYF7_9GAMM|nr:P-aminobenzoate N-oxygenase AurF [Candidatus Berkiella aquae]MCS5710313.1 hypothetical protein [Candidatus Berkiella aquae]